MNRVGIGYDIHRLIEGRRLILGGVDIPFEKGLLGHSDADVLLHAMSDAILGALSHGDIGVYFPPDDERYKDMSSAIILKKALSAAGEEGFHVVNIDCVVIAEKPPLSKYYKKIIDSLSGITGLQPSSISVKAKTNEGVDAVGRGEAIAAYAVVMLEK
ncbi:MAG: 2-C-methyl-D-erythritol 2,4-cyclodiphosphate synthase [Deltaproteobacteria bacterium]|nr:2-C-methyl-D-erythritol 2,4-cyclodiphosphate synthase [Deltaproteobacteria bacterium]